MLIATDDATIVPVHFICTSVSGSSAQQVALCVVRPAKHSVKAHRQHQMASTSSSPSSSGYGTLSKNSAAAVRNMQKQQNSVFGSSTMVLLSFLS
ncbi:unnamed protein product [Litomosoides sigmodontis]|uniref:Uncharacterized protein n=1 Tax=Litomosoides sigmodontis TaxID=42156 RepID=A0A3P7JYJ4_LITSI|nr:unnamed protein product [Litomosoides sigmodontis]